MKNKALFIAALVVVIFVIVGFATNWFKGNEPAATPEPTSVVIDAAPTDVPVAPSESAPADQGTEPTDAPAAQ